VTSRSQVLLQDSHFDHPICEKVPDGHDLQNVDPVVFVYDPDGQRVHWPGFIIAVPNGHGSHLLLPAKLL
jgi:hypothetical protein